MKASEVYARAAEFADTAPACGCYALSIVSGQPWGAGEFYEQFEEYFAKGQENNYGGWFGSCYQKTNQLHRVLALCLMSAIAADAENSVRRKPKAKAK